MRKLSSVKKIRRLTPFQIIVLGFMALISLGTLLLMLPISSSTGQVTNFFDAFFTATSAVCVTGLIVKDTATYWTWFGQFVIISLIQIGGLGVVTVVVGFTMTLGRKIGLMQRNTMQAAISAPQVGGIMRLTNFVIKTTFVAEGLGAVIMAPVFIKDFGFFRGCWMGVFHSISAFCNAGFDLMGYREQFSSLTTYQSSLVINCVIMALIIMGGIGFITWDDFRKRKFNFKRYSLQSKVAVSVSFFLIVLPAILFYFVDFNASGFEGMTKYEKILASVFQAVTPRTAGFNTVDLTKLSDISLFVTICLMLVGGSPGSTAGGIKTTTFGVLLAVTVSVVRRKRDANIFKRRISDEIIKNAAVLLIMYLVLFITATLLICGIDKVPFVSALFESASAIGTVGLSLGITAALSVPSRLILCVLMFFGRVGGLTLIFATTSLNNSGARAPLEGINVG
ncbi:MAG: TrkH family potassium uptake protein [Christensenellaceae bacterium]